jgi:indolepyruvate ferredoxin oxidoreductase, beta subunit
MADTNIMIVGVGGQGTLLSSRIMGAVALKKSFDVKLSEVHGMAQRGGSVVTYVKMGYEVFSPLIEKGEADFIIAFEELEALRWSSYLKSSGKMIINTQKIPPLSVTNGKDDYPSDVAGTLRNYFDVTTIDAYALGKECGNVRTFNIVLMGVMANMMYIEKDLWIEAIKELVPSGLVDANLKAFEIGYGY